MNLKDRLKNWLLKKLGYKKLNENPNSSRFTYINDAEEVQLDKVKEAGRGRYNSFKKLK